MWVFNVFLYLNFLFNPTGYVQWVAAGAPCYGAVVINGQASSGPEPSCFYDPTNTN